MTAVVAGGAGFVGSHLCELLLRRGFRVVCADNLITGSRRNVRRLSHNNAFRFACLDVTRPISISGRVDVVYHLASPASPRDYLTYPLQTLSANSTGTEVLLELARRKKSVFVLASTSEVYGDPKIHPQRESYWGNVNPVGPRSVYDEAKRYAEAVTMAFHRQHGLPVRIARIFNTYGPRMRRSDGRVVPTLIDQALTGAPLTIHGTGRQTRSFCYVSDLVEALLRIAGCSEPGPINLGNPQEITMLRLASIIRRLTCSTSTLAFEPYPEDGPRRRRPDIRRARRLLRWTPTVAITEGLVPTIDWFRTKPNPA